MAISKSKLKSYIEVISKISQDAVDMYDGLANMISLSENTDKVWGEYSIGESNGCTSVLKLALAKVSERISRLKVILDTLLCAYEDYMDEEFTDNKSGCSGDCLNCSDFIGKKYSLIYYLDEEFDEDDESEEDDEDEEDVPFKLDITDDVGEAEFDAIIASIRESLYGNKKVSKSKDESVKTKTNNEKCGNKNGKSKAKSECSEGVRSDEPANAPIKKKTKGKA